MTLKKTFAILMTLFVITFFVLLNNHSPKPFGDQTRIFFFGGKDMFADFFNPNRYSADGSAYFSKINEWDGHTGFPLGGFLKKPIKHVVNYSGMSLEDCWHSNLAMITCFFYILFLFVVWWDSIQRLSKKHKFGTYNTYLLLFSSIFIFTIERGNNILFSAAAINYFLFFYNSDKQRYRYFALVCLCIASVMKIFPVVFGVLLLRDKRYKDIGFCIIISLLLAFVPFFFIDRGLENIPKMIENASINTSFYQYRISYTYGLSKFACAMVNVLHVSSYEAVTKIARITVTALAIIAILLSLREKIYWKRLALIIGVLLLYPNNCNLYCGLYLFPLIIVFLGNNKVNKYNLFLTILFCIVLSPVQFEYKDTTLSPVFANFCLIIIWLLIILSSFIDFIKRKEYLNLKKNH